MHKLKIFFLICIVMYILLVNILSTILLANPTLFSNDSYYLVGGTKVQVGFGDKVTTNVMRPRFYGTIYETEEFIRLEIFDIVPLPLKVNGSNWIYYHLVSLILLILIFRNKLNKEKEKKQWEKSRNFGSTTFG